MRVLLQMTSDLFTRVQAAAAQVEQPLPAFVAEVLVSDLATRILQTLPPRVPRSGGRRAREAPLRTHILRLPRV